MCGSKRVWMSELIFILLVVKGWWSEGCLEQERSALLQLKRFFNNNKCLQNWVDAGDEENYSDCCQWEGVECNNTTGRVIKLDLGATRNRESAEWHMNASLFTPFQQLESLHLIGNNIAGCVENEGLDRLSRLNNLKFLFLDDNYFNNSIFSSLGGLSSLRHLSLAVNRLNGSIDIKDFRKFKNLEHLDMGGVQVDVNTSFLQIVGESMPSLKFLSLADSSLNKNTILDQGLCQLVQMQELYIGGIDLRGSLPWCLANMTSLQVLDASSNQLTGNISPGLCELVLLRELSIHNNDLRGSLPLCLSNLTSLRVLDASHNQLTENISSSPLMHLTSIEELILSNNHFFQIPISLEPLFNLSKLKTFEGEICIETESHYNSLTPKFQLTSISLSGYIDGGTFPKFLYHQHDLKNADLSHLNLSGKFPNWLVENNTNLETLLLANNSLFGSFRMPIHSHQKLAILDANSFLLKQMRGYK